MTIPASQFADVTPSVLSAGGASLALTGVIVSASAEFPMNTLVNFQSASDVADYCGQGSIEYALAKIYFLGFDNSQVKPAQLGFWRYSSAAADAWLRGASLGAMTLAQLQALSGSLSVAVDGSTVTAAAINLATATSFSDAAAKISTALGVTVSYSSLHNAFVVASPTTGAASTIAYAGGTLADPLKLSQAAGAVLSQGVDAQTPSVAMNALINRSTNWASFMTTFEPALADKLAFAQWTNSMNNRYVYAAWDTDQAPVSSSAATASFGYQAIVQAGYSGVVAIAQDNNAELASPGKAIEQAAFLMGAIGSIDFSQNQGRTNLAFKSQSGLNATVTDQAAYNNLKANGYNAYCAVATANQGFVFFAPGQIGGKFAWVDSYVNQIWMNSQFQLAMMTLLTQAKSIPYNALGYSLVTAALADPIQQAVTFGAIQPGVALSSLQAAQINAAAGQKVDQLLSSVGWFLQIAPATAQTRGQRKSPPINFWYMDGGSIQELKMSSVEVQ